MAGGPQILRINIDPDWGDGRINIDTDVFLGRGLGPLEEETPIIVHALKNALVEIAAQQPQAGTKFGGLEGVENR